MSDKLMKCPACSGRGYNRCECWPGDCICGYGDETCDECAGDGWIDQSYDDFFPEFETAESPSPTEGMVANKIGQNAVQRAQSDFMEALAQDGYLDTERCLEPKSAAYIQKLLNLLCDAARKDLRLELAATIREGISAVADAKQKSPPETDMLEPDVNHITVGRQTADEFAQWLHAGNSSGSLSPHAIDGLADSVSRVVLAMQAYHRMEIADMADNFRAVNVGRVIEQMGLMAAETPPEPIVVAPADFEQKLATFLTALDEWGCEDSHDRAQHILEFQRHGYDLDAYLVEHPDRAKSELN